MKLPLALTLTLTLSLVACSKFNGSPEAQFEKFKSAAEQGDLTTAYSYLYDPKGYKKKRLAEMPTKEKEKLGENMKKMSKEFLSDFRLVEKECFLTEEEIKQQDLPAEFLGVCAYSYESSDGDINKVNFVYSTDKWEIQLPL